MSAASIALHPPRTALLTAYFDGSCALCSAEMNALHDGPRDQVLVYALIDIVKSKGRLPRWRWRDIVASLLAPLLGPYRGTFVYGAITATKKLALSGRVPAGETRDAVQAQSKLGTRSQ